MREYLVKKRIYIMMKTGPRKIVENMKVPIQKKTANVSHLL